MVRYDNKIKEKPDAIKALYREEFKMKRVNKKKFELEIWIYEFHDDSPVSMELYTFDSLAKMLRFKKETCENSPFPLNPHIYN